MTDQPDRFVIEVRYGHHDWTYPAWEGFEIAESEARVIEQIASLADDVDDLRVTRFNMDGSPTRYVTEDLMDEALVRWFQDALPGKPMPNIFDKVARAELRKWWAA